MAPHSESKSPLHIVNSIVSTLRKVCWIFMETSANTIEIVRATIEDLPRIVPLFDGYRQFYKYTSDLEGAHRFLSAHFTENSSVIFLAFRTDAEGKRHACGFTQLYPSFSSGAMRRLWI